MGELVELTMAAERLRRADETIEEIRRMCTALFDEVNTPGRKLTEAEFLMGYDAMLGLCDAYKEARAKERAANG